MEAIIKSNEKDFVSSRQIAEVTEKRHADVMRDIRILINKSAIDLITNLNANLRSIQDEPICIENQYTAQNGKLNPEFLLNEYATNVLAASYDPVIARKLIKLVQRLKKAITKAIDTPDVIMAKALLMAKETMDRQQKQLELANIQIQHQAPKVEYYDQVLDSKKLTATNVIANDLGVTAQALNKTLKKCGIIYRVNGTWVLTAKYRGKELAKTKTYPYTDSHGNKHTAEHLYWTEKGREFIFNNFSQGQ